MLPPWIIALRKDPTTAKLLRSIALSRRFQFFIVIAEPDAEYAVLSLIKEDVPALRKRPIHLWQIDPYEDYYDRGASTGDLEREVLGQLLSAENLPNDPDRVTVISATGVEERDKEAWSLLFQRMNERRNSITKSLPGPLVIFLPPHLERVFAESAPDFFSISGLVAHIRANKQSTTLKHIQEIERLLVPNVSTHGLKSRRRVLVISDLHLGGPPEVRRLLPESESRLAAFFRWAGRQRNDDTEIHLVIAGNFFDFLLEPPHSAFTADEALAMQKLDQIIYRSRGVFSALTDFVQRRGRLTILLGDRDLELSLPGPRARFLELLGPGRVELLVDGEALRVGPVLIEHGSRYDRWSAVDYDAIRRFRAHLSRGESADPPRPPPGNLLYVDVILPLKSQYPFIDMLVPEAALTPLLELLDPSLSSVVMRSARLSGQTGLYEGVGDSRPLQAQSQNLLNQITQSSRILSNTGTRGRTYGLLRGLFRSSPKDRMEMLQQLREALQPLAEEQGRALRLDYEHPMLLNRALAAIDRGCQIVVFGHTHICRSIKLSHSGHYLNTGSWIEQVRLPTEVFSKDESTALYALDAFMDGVISGRMASLRWQRPSFVIIDLDAEQRVLNADLLLVDEQGHPTPLN